jgi:hypothetical protein
MSKMVGKKFELIATATAAALLLVAIPDCSAFPPAPDHVFYGMVRDEMGNPLNLKRAEVFLETATGTQVKTAVAPGGAPGVNYKLAVPMDAGLTADAYKPTALQPTVSFKIWVRIGGVRYLPIQMKGDYSHLGEPGQRTHLDLTLGEDSDNDGLPDAWERALISSLGGNKTLADINPNDDADGDGLSNLQEYLAGTYAFDPKDGFTLNILRTVGANPVLEFLAITGHSYSVLASDNLHDWNKVSFRMGGSISQAAENYYANDTRNVQVEAVSATGQSSFYKLIVN